MNNKPSRAVFESWLATTGINLTDINPYALASWDAWQACETYSQSKINLVRDQRDQQSQRIGELEGLLDRVKVSLSLDDTEWGYSAPEKYKLLADIRAALSAGKEVE